MTLSVLETYKELFKIKEYSTSDYSSHLQGEKELSVPSAKEVRFAREKIIGEFNDNLEDCPVVNISGTAYLFFVDWIEKKNAYKLLDKILMAMGCKGEKTFQHLPFFKGEGSSDKAYGLDARHFDEAVLEIAKRKKTVREIEKWYSELPFNDAPPCLQSYMLQGNEISEEFVPYFLAKDGKLPEEVFDIKTVEYFKRNTPTYPCGTQNKVCEFCNKRECQKRKYKPDGDFVSSLDFGPLKRYDCGNDNTSVYYIWKINGKDIKFFSDSSLVLQNSFINRCVRDLGVLPRKVNEEQWRGIVNRALYGMNVVPIKTMEKQLPDRLKGLFINSLRNRVIISTEPTVAKLLQGYVYLNPLTFTLILDSQGLCSYISANYKAIEIVSYTQFTKALRSVGFRCGERSIEREGKSVWYMRLSDLITDEKKWNEFVIDVSRGTIWEENIDAYIDESTEESTVNFNDISDREKEAIEQDALIYLDTEKEARNDDA